MTQILINWTQAGQVLKLLKRVNNLQDVGKCHITLSFFLHMEIVVVNTFTSNMTVCHHSLAVSVRILCVAAWSPHTPPVVFPFPPTFSNDRIFGAVWLTEIATLLKDRLFFLHCALKKQRLPCICVCVCESVCVFLLRDYFEFSMADWEFFFWSITWPAVADSS